MRFSTLAAVSAVALASSVAAYPTPVNDYDLAARGDEEFYLRSLFYEEEDELLARGGTSAGETTAGGHPAAHPGARPEPGHTTSGQAHTGTGRPEPGQVGETTGGRKPLRQNTTVKPGEKIAVDPKVPVPNRKHTVGFVNPSRRSVFYEIEDDLLARGGTSAGETTAAGHTPSRTGARPDVGQVPGEIPGHKGPVRHTTLPGEKIDTHKKAPTRKDTVGFVNPSRRSFYYDDDDLEVRTGQAASEPAERPGAIPPSNGRTHRKVARGLDVRDLGVEEIMEIITRAYYDDSY